MKYFSKKTISLFLVLAILLCSIPITIFAIEKEMVYISVSYDDKYIKDKDGGYIAYVGVPLADVENVDLEEYGLSDYLYDKDGDGTYETTALQLIIYAHENLYGGSWDDIDFTGAPGSSYFQGGIFGFDENLNYFLNGIYPMDEELSAAWGYGVGATSDRIVLSAGDVIEMGSFSSWDFYQDTGYGFHEFADTNGNFVHTYTVAEDTALPVKLVRSYSGMGSGAEVYDEPGYTVFYGKTYDNAIGTMTTNDNGCTSVTFTEPGTYYLWCDGGYGYEFSEAIVSTPAFAVVKVTADTTPDAPRQPQDVSAVLNATMAKMATKVTAPAFGTNAGEWTVLSLARGGYYAKDNAYFTDYYSRIVETVNTTATSVNMNGALHKNKSTDNSRLIVALSAIGKDATSVGDWNLVEAYSANGLDWIKKQGINGPIWALIALDSGDYVTSNATIRQQCIDFILDKQHDDGGWSLMANLATASDPDITGMTLQALYPYRNQEAVATACAEAFDCLSAMQSTEEGKVGHFLYGGAPNAESAAQVIVACTTWGINPDTDPRFIKNGISAVDAVLAHYVESEAEFKHIIAQPETNAMATDQACYALVAYDRLLKGKNSLYDCSDVTFGSNDEAVAGKPKAIFGLPQQISNDAGKSFNATVSIDQWNNTAGYKLIDFILNVPAGLSVTNVTAGNRLSGGTVNYNLENDNGKLRVVYFDANNHNDITVSGDEFPAELFTITFSADSVNDGDKLNLSLGGMSIKLNSDSSDKNAMIVVDTSTANGTIDVVKGISYSAVCLYRGDDVDLIPSSKKAVAVSVVGTENKSKLTYNDGTHEYEFKYSAEISDKTGVATYVAIVDASVDMAEFANKANFLLADDDASELTFGDSNGDGVINAQDALNAVDTWLRKADTPSDDEILVLNVNGDSRINTFDALGIVEAFVDGSEYVVVTKAANLTTNN